MSRTQKDLLIAIDVGTTAIKMAAIDRNMRLVATFTAPQPVQYPQPLCVEQVPEDWWSGLSTGLRALSDLVPGLAERTAVLGVAAQVCGVVPVDRDGKPLRPCMISLDKRSGAMMRKKMGGFPSIAGFNAFKLLRSIQLTNGAPSLSGMDPTGKMMWLRLNEPEVWSRTAKLLDVKDWLLHRMTGRFVASADSANLTWLADTRRGETAWSAELLKRFGVPREKMPEIVAGNSIVGGLTGEAASQLGLLPETPVIAGCSDICAAALGSGATGDGALHICLGTSAWIAGFFNGRRFNALASYATINSPVSNRPLLIAAQECAGASLDWFGRISGLPRDFAHDPDKDLPLFLPWLAGERVPIDDNRIAGAFLGLRLDHDKRSLAQSVAEGVALNLRWAMSFVAKTRGIAKDDDIRLVGGASLNAALCQILSDCLQLPLIRQPEPQFAGLRGIAALAGEAIGWYDSALAAVAERTSSETTLFVPDPGKAEYYTRRFEMFRRAHKMFAPWYHAFARDLQRD